MKNLFRVAYGLGILSLLIFVAMGCSEVDQGPVQKDVVSAFVKPELKIPSGYIPNYNAKTWLPGEGWAKAYDVTLEFEEGSIFGAGSELHTYKATIKDGVVEGTFEVYNWDGEGEPTTWVKGDVTCIVFEEDCSTVRMVGLITDGSDEDYIGLYAAWISVDNGVGNDVTTDLRYALNPAQANYHCLVGYTPAQFSLPELLETSGNVKVKSMDCYGNVTGEPAND